LTHCCLEEKAKHKVDDHLEEDLKEEEAKFADLKRQKKSKKKPKAEEEEPDPDDELYKIMGLGKFGGSKKNN
jgi:predicted flap endonuclease-1-like 5' DNA nuclease